MIAMATMTKKEPKAMPTRFLAGAHGLRAEPEERVRHNDEEDAHGDRAEDCSDEGAVGEAAPGTAAGLVRGLEGGDLGSRGGRG